MTLLETCVGVVSASCQNARLSECVVVVTRKTTVPEWFLVGQLNQELDDLTGREVFEVGSLEVALLLLVPRNPTLAKFGTNLEISI